nr:iron-siderophore ABC transporter substrate-binding protein [Vibrio sinus]
MTSPPKRVVVLDWALAETLVSIGVKPVGVADAKGYRQWVEIPKLPQSVVDVGSRTEPNLELIAQLKPDLIIASNHLSLVYQQLSKIAPTKIYTIYDNNKSPYLNAKRITLALGKLFHRSKQANSVVSETEQVLKDDKRVIQEKGKNNKPVLFVRFINDNTVRIHGKGALINSVASAMGLTNVWTKPTNLWGFTTVGVPVLAQYQDANIVILGPLSSQQKTFLQHSALWNAMKFVKQDSVYTLPAIWTFGGLIDVQRFSQNITKAFTHL